MPAESFGNAPSERAERLVPGARVDELAEHYPGDAEIEELAHRARLSRALAVAAFVAAEQDFDQLRAAVVARHAAEPIKMRDAKPTEVN